MRMKVCGRNISVFTNDAAPADPVRTQAVTINPVDPEGLNNGRVGLHEANFRYSRLLHSLNERNKKFWETHAIGGTE